MLVPDVAQHQPLGRSRPACLGEQRVRGKLPAPHFDERAGDAADHVAEEAVRRDGEAHDVSFSHHRDRFDGARRRRDFGIGDGREDDWAVVNAATEEITAALIDANDDGEADAVAYGDGKREELPTAVGVIRSKFQY